MSNPRKGRTSDSGQYVSPLLNELEWLEDDTEEPIKTDDRSRSRSRKSARKPQSQKRTKRRKNGPTAQINFVDAMAAVAAKQVRRPAPPLLLIDKPKLHYPRVPWLKELFDIEPWTERNSGELADALHSFQLGLDGIMKSGEELHILPPRRRAVVIDVAPQFAANAPADAAADAGAAAAEPTAAPSSDSNETGELQAEEADAKPTVSAAPRLQRFGLVPFRFGPYNDWVDIEVAFGERFADDGYALVATTNEPGCRTVIIGKTADSAIVRLLRDSLSPELSGELNWIALGDGL